MAVRFAFDLGTNSIGWAVFELGTRRTSNGNKEQFVPKQLVALGAHVFDNGRDPKTQNTLGSLRREPRSARRRRDRTVQRRTYVLSLLELYGLLPPEGVERDQLMERDPYSIRNKGANEKISLHELGRAFFHLNRRRGFKSNRKTDIATNGDDMGKIASAGSRLQSLLAENGHSTLGQFLADRQASSNPRDRKPVRVRLNGQGANALYEFYPTRDMVEFEFIYLWDQQAKYHVELTEERKAHIFKAIFHQRDLKPVEPGRCTFFPNENRLPRCNELAQEFRVYQQLNNIRLIDNRAERSLSVGERDDLADVLMSGPDLSWKAVKKKLGLDGSTAINLEIGGEKHLQGNTIAQVMMGKTSRKPGPLREHWHSLTVDEKNRTIEVLENSETNEEVIAWSIDAFSLGVEEAKQLARIRLPDGHIRLGATATGLIVEQLKAHVVTYDKAASMAGLNHSILKTDECFDRLPAYNRIGVIQRYLGTSTNKPTDPPDIRYGRIANPTVHIALNQLRRIVNALVDIHGKPDQIVIELAREIKQSSAQKSEASRNRDKNRAANDKRRKDLFELGVLETGQTQIGDLLIRMRLWEELGETPRQCPYTGKTISLTSLFSDEVEIEHILPLSRTLDDSISNKTVSMRSANRLKRNLSPTEAARKYPGEFDLQAIRDRAKSMPVNKRWRFEDDAMERFEEGDSFLDRQLNDTQYLSRVAKVYLESLFPLTDDAGNQHQHVWVVTGRLTSLLRRVWGVNLTDDNFKNRDDHRHHALDAAVIGVIDRALVQRVSTVAAKREIEGVKRLLAKLEEPYAGYRKEVGKKISNLVATSRSKHSASESVDRSYTTGRLHEDTNYGIVKDMPDNEDDLSIGNVVVRKGIMDLSDKEVRTIRDTKIRDQLFQILNIDPDTQKTQLNKNDYLQALGDWSDTHKIRRVRILKVARGARGILDKSSREPYRYVIPDGNAYMDIYENSSGKWVQQTTDIFQANTCGADPVPEDWKFLIRLHRHDYIQVLDRSLTNNQIMKVHSLDKTNNRIKLASANEGGELQKRHGNQDDPFRWDVATISKLKERKARRVRYTPAGRLKTIPHGKR